MNSRCLDCGDFCTAVGYDEERGAPSCAAESMTISPDALKWFDTFATVRDALIAHGYPMTAATERAQRAVGKLR